MSPQFIAETARTRAASYRINLLAVPVELRFWRRLNLRGLNLRGLERWRG